MEPTGSLVIGYYFSNGKDKSILIVGEKRMNQSMEIINAFQGEEAEWLYKKLVGEKGEMV